MKMLIKLLPYFAVGFVLGLLGLLLGRFVFPAPKGGKQLLTTQTILQKVSNQGFLVTHSIVTEQKVQSKIDRGSEWSNFWWGHEVEARATMQVSYGINLALLDEKDIFIDTRVKTLCIAYPEPTVHSVSVIGDIEVVQKSGVLKALLAKDTNADYNLALQLLDAQAKESAATVMSAGVDAFIQADNTLSFLISDSGYSVVSTCR